MKNKRKTNNLFLQIYRTVLYLLVFCIFLIFVYILTFNFFQPSASQIELFPNKEQLVSNQEALVLNQEKLIPSQVEVIANDVEISKAQDGEAAIKETTPPEKKIIPNLLNLKFTSFFDSFASPHLIDDSRTNLYRDNFSAAVYFPLDYNWEKVPTDANASYGNELEDFYLNDFSRPEIVKDLRCIEANCIEQKGLNISYQGREIVFPPEIKRTSLASVSIGTVGTRWLVGFVLKNGEKNFSGRVYYFDGQKFTPLFFANQEVIISSPYLGYFGFGGEESDFIIIYGAYQGKAYRFQNAKITDISLFFDYRVMAQGFHPEIIKTPLAWYVFSASVGRPRLIKLWSDNNDKISGEAVYVDGPLANGQVMPFIPLKDSANGVGLLTKIKTSHGEEELWLFSDKGFKNNNLRRLYFKPIAISAGTSIKIIANSLLGSKNLPCPEAKLFFSSDNKSWQELPLGLGINYDFSIPDLNKYYLRVDFQPQKNKFYSPFLAEVAFDVYYQK